VSEGIKMRDVMPFSALRRGVQRPQLHVLISIKSMLRTTEKGVSCITEDDLEGCFGQLIDKPSSDLISLIKSNATSLKRHPHDAASLMDNRFKMASWSRHPIKAPAHLGPGLHTPGTRRWCCRSGRSHMRHNGREGRACPVPTGTQWRWRQ